MALMTRETCPHGMALAECGACLYQGDRTKVRYLAAAAAGIQVSEPKPPPTLRGACNHSILIEESFVLFWLNFLEK